MRGFFICVNYYASYSYIYAMGISEWISSKAVSEILGVSTARVRQQSAKASNDIRLFQYVRKVQPKGSGVKTWEWRRDYLEIIKGEKMGLRKSVNANAKAYANTPNAYDKDLKSETMESEALGLVIPEIGFYEKMDDGTIIERFSPELYEAFRATLIEHPILKKQVDGHSDELERLQTTYEDHIKTYEAQTQYLRKQLDNTQKLLGDVIATLKDKTLIDAGELILRAKGYKDGE